MKRLLPSICIPAALWLFTAHSALGWYSSSAGRWLSRDPQCNQGFVASKHPRHGFRSVEIELYNYVRNDAINGYDILGLDRQPGGGLHGCCAAHDVQNPPKTCDEICQLARNDPANIPQAGMAGIVCFGDKKCPCILNLSPIGVLVGECPQLEQLLLDHEKQHMNDVDCNKCGLYRPPFKNPDDSTKSECDKRKQDIAALDAYLASSSEGSQCKDAAKALQDNDRNWVQANCH